MRRIRPMKSNCVFTSASHVSQSSRQAEHIVEVVVRLVVVEEGGSRTREVVLEDVERPVGGALARVADEVGERCSATGHSEQHIAVGAMQRIKLPSSRGTPRVGQSSDEGGLQVAVHCIWAAESRVELVLGHVVGNSPSWAELAAGWRSDAVPEALVAAQPTHALHVQVVVGNAQAQRLGREVLVLQRLRLGRRGGTGCCHRQCRGHERLRNNESLCSRPLAFCWRVALLPRRVRQSGQLLLGPWLAGGCVPSQSLPRFVRFVETAGAARGARGSLTQ